MRVRWSIQEVDFALAKDMATEQLSAAIDVPVASLTLRVVTWMLCAAALIAVIEALRFGPGYGSTIVLAASGLAAVAAYGASQSLLRKAARRAQLRASGPFPIPYELEVRQTGLQTSGQDIDAHFGWRVVESVKELPQCVSITLRWGVLLVPNDAFDTIEQRKEFVGAVRNGVASAAPERSGT